MFRENVISDKLNNFLNKSKQSKNIEKNKNIK